MIEAWINEIISRMIMNDLVCSLLLDFYIQLNEF